MRGDATASRCERGWPSAVPVPWHHRGATSNGTGEGSGLGSMEMDQDVVDEPVLPDALWRCRPSISDDAVARSLDGQMLIWPAEATIGSVDAVAAIVLRWLDGTAELGEIAEDFAIAAEVAVDAARRFVGHLVRRLAAVGALDGLDAVLDDLLAPPADQNGDDRPPR